MYEQLSSVAYEFIILLPYVLHSSNNQNFIDKYNNLFCSFTWLYISNTYETYPIHHPFYMSAYGKSNLSDDTIFQRGTCSNATSSVKACNVIWRNRPQLFIMSTWVLFAKPKMLYTIHNIFFHAFIFIFSGQSILNWMKYQKSKAFNKKKPIFYTIWIK